MFEQVLNLLESGKKDDAIFECRRIVGLFKNNPNVLKFCADIAVRCDEPEDAVKWLRNAVRLSGRKADYHYCLGTVYMNLQRFDEAIVSFKMVLDIDTHHADTHLKLGLAYCCNGAYRKALNPLQQAIQSTPGRAAPYCWLGMAYGKLSLDQKAEECFARALEIDPNFAEAQLQLGLLYLSRGQLVPSRDFFYRVISADENNWQALGNLCMVLRDLGELDEAGRVGHRAAKLNPSLFEVWHNLGNVYKDMGVFHEAAAYYAKAIQINPESAVTHVGMGVALHRNGDNEKAVQFFKRALKYNPSEGTAISNLYNISMMDCDWEKAGYYKQLIHDATIQSLRKSQVPSETPFLNLARCDDPELNFAVARAWSRDIDNRVSEIRKSLRFQYARNPAGKIRIGYLSNNFGDHPTAHITRKLYELHDRSRFEIFCYSYGDDDNSCYRKAIQEGCDVFVDIRNSSHTQAAKQINDDGINILVDLVGYMKGGRVAIPALRPAPVQVRWLGMAGTTGADFFDYLIADEMVTPKNQSDFYSEKFIYLPYCYQINDNQPFMEEGRIRRSDFELPEDAFVFCCFNTSYKIEKSVFEAWLKILKRTSKSVLWLMTSSARMQSYLTKIAVQNELEPKRLVFADKAPKNRHLARLALADLALDTCMVNGAASTSDALWSGVPVLTICGRHFASRMSSSILKAIGLEELITQDLYAYTEKAVQLAKDKGRLGRIRTLLQKNRTTTPLFNTESFVVSLEWAYEKVWTAYLNGEERAIIEV